MLIGSNMVILCFPQERKLRGCKAINNIKSEFNYRFGSRTDERNGGNRSARSRSVFASCRRRDHACAHLSPGPPRSCPYLATLRTTRSRRGLTPRTLTPKWKWLKKCLSHCREERLVSITKTIDCNGDYSAFLGRVDI